MADISETRPLEGITVIDFCAAIAGPGTGMYLADQGADVIKVEPPGDGTASARGSGLWLAFNRGKRSIVLDLKSPEGKEVAYDLARQADVMLVAWPPGGADRLGMGYETISALNPRIVYFSLTGWGYDGPHTMKLGWDLIVQGFSGVMDSQRAHDGTPVAASFYVADVAIPMYMAYAITLALWQRDKSGVGQKVETTQVQAQMAMQFINLVEREGSSPDGAGSWDWRRPSYTFQAADGEYLVMAGAKLHEWGRLWEILELPDFPNDPRMGPLTWPKEMADEWYPRIAERFMTDTRDHWLQKLADGGLAHMSGPVLSRAELMQHEQVLKNGMTIEQQHPKLGPVRMPATPFSLSRNPVPTPTPAPEYGQHTSEILAELGYPSDRIHALRSQGVVE